METVDMKSPKQSTCQTNPIPLDERPSSPNDCAICLEQLSDKSFTNSCLHMFCFHCLLAWSKVKPECPLCKQDFHSIIHNIRSMDDYDEYQVPPSALRFATPDSASFLSSNIPPSLSFFPRTRDYFSANRRFFSYSTTLLQGQFSVPRQRTSSLVIQPYVDNLQIQNESYGMSSSSHSFPRLNRKEVYLRELEIRPPTIGRHRICAPEFYRENEGQMHRLGRWLNRELVAISQLGMRFHPNAVLSLIMELLPMYNIQSTYFYDALYPYLGIYTRRFIREFYHFAVSPYDMDQYDRECVYVRQRTGSQLAFIVTVGGDDSEDVQVIPNPPVNHSHSVNPWIGVNDLPTTPYNRTVPSSRPRSTNLPANRCSFSFLPSRESTSHQVIHISDSENDDCAIIDEVHQTPETIILDDSDTEITVSVPLTSSTKPMINQSTSPVDLSYQPSTSNSLTDYKNKLFLPSTSKDEPSKSPILVASSSSSLRVRLKSTSKRRSSSNSSVISTDNSVVGSESSLCEGSSRLHKRRSRYRDHSKRRNCARKSYQFFSDTSSVESDKDDLDYGKTISKRKRKTKKHDKSEKKSKKRHKTYRTKSPKRKKSPLKDKGYGVSRNEIDFGSCSSYNFKNLHSVYDAMVHVNGNSNKPKLRSVVKKVNKSETLVAKTESEKKCRLSEDDNLPGTSFGFRPSRDRKFNSFVGRQIGFSSDSD